MSYSKSTLLVVVTLLLVTAAAFLAQDSGLPYRKAATWQDTMLASREAMRDPNDPLTGVFPGVWSASESYAAKGAQGFNAAFPPEQGGQDVKWTAHREWLDGDVHSVRLTENGVMYLRRTISAQKDTTVTASFGSKDGLSVWLNGQQVVNDQTRRRAAPDQMQAPLQLKKGDNELLLKIWNRGGKGNAGHYFALIRPADAEQRRKANLDRLWDRLQKDFPDDQSYTEMLREQKDWIWGDEWPNVQALANRYAEVTRGRYGAEARSLAAKVQKPSDLAAVRSVYARARNIEEVREILETTDPEAVRLAVDDVMKTFGSRYAKGGEYLRKLGELEKAFNEARSKQENDADIERLTAQVRQYKSLSREALLANPMLNFDKVLVTRRNFGQRARKVISKPLGMPNGNSWTNEDIAKTGWDNEIAVMTNLRGRPKLTTFYKPTGGKFLNDVELDFDASKIMFSSIGSSERWRVFEIKANGTGLRQLSPDVPDVDFFDSCYLPNGKIVFASTAGYQGMPCIGGGAPMAQLYTSDPSGKNIRQLTFEQDSDWTPAVLNDGRLLYLRWEYADLPHYFTRLLFASNPDGTGAREYFHSNSYFPNAFFYAKAIPGHASEVAGIASGHHGVSRSGRLLIVDPDKGRSEADGVVQEIPGRNKRVEAIIKDPLVDGVWPQFLQPYPLADYSDPAHPVGGGKYFLVAMKRDPNALWGIYLVDKFDNLTLIKEIEGAALLEPIGFQPTPRPPVIPEKIKPGEKSATVYLSDVYSGQGLNGIPRGKVKSLRLFTYHFNYNRTGGHDSVGIQSGWDIKRILGTVPVEEDGSASFKIPANTPVTVQPLDEQGRALQLMRSWFVGMPGEVVSCVGCHDRLNSTPQLRPNLAMRRAPSEVKNWYGPPRPFGYRTEVQPVLDRYCVGCHDGRNAPNGKAMPNFVAEAGVTHFTQDRSYIGLQFFVHRYGPESDVHLPKPMEYHASTSPLVQILSKGHYNVQLDNESWDRLTTWIDLNVPWRGSWGVKGDAESCPQFRELDQVKRRRELSMMYAGVTTDPEKEFAETVAKVAQLAKPAPIMPKPMLKPAAFKLNGWPFDSNEASRKQSAAGGQATRSFDLGNGLKIELALVPAGSFVMGDPNGQPDEHPLSAVKIDKPFWMGRVEISNQVYSLFDPKHDSRVVDKQAKDHNVAGYPANDPQQPVIRVSWEQAMSFCKWLSQKTGQRFTLPTEAQWEWAARAGSATPFWFGGVDTDFARFANLADKRIKGFEARFLGGKMFNYFMNVDYIDDGEMITGPVGKYRPNPWGLFDMNGNVAEWTLSTYKAYPYNPRDGRDDWQTPGPKVVRGGSWRDMPVRATSATRLSYQPYQPVYDVGFRVIMEAEPNMHAAR